MNIQPTALTGTARNDERGSVADLQGAGMASAIKDSAAPSSPAAPGVAKAGGVDATGRADGAAPSRAELSAALKQINQSLPASSQGLEFSVDEDSKQTVVKLVDRNTHEVLRQMPSKEALEIARSLDKAMGKLIDQKA